MNKDPVEKKIYRDHFYTHDWIVDRANQDFICEFKGCSTKIKKCDLFIFNDKCEDEKNYCIIHGIKKIH